MFYSETILSKRGPLAKVWLAANWERKLSKSQFLQTNIEAVVGTMLGGNQPPMALRLSAQLLLGVVRIYSRKARYLLEDCNEALMKIKMHFRPGAVDMPDHSVANVNAITMADAMTEFDILLPEPSFDLRSFLAQPPEDSTPASLNISRSQDITLADTSFVAGAHEEELRDIFGLEDTNPEDLAGGWSLGLGLGEEEAPPGPAESSGPVDDSMEIEVGRDAAAEQPFSPGRRESLSFADDPSFSRDKDISLPEFGEPMDMDRLPEGEELFPGGEIELPPLSAGEEEPELFQVPDTVEVRSPEPEPETAVRDQKKKAQSRKRKLIVDDAIEMDNDQFLKAINDTSDILQEQRFVPASRKMQKLLDIRAQGAAYYLNTPAYDDYPAELQFLFRVRTRTVAQTGEETTARKRKAESIEPAAEEREPEEHQPEHGGLADESAVLADEGLHLPDVDFQPESYDTTNVEPVPESLELPREESPTDLGGPTQKRPRKLTEEEEDEATRNTSEEADVVQFDDSQDQPNDMGFSRSTLQTIKTLQSKFDTQDDGEKELLYNDLTASARRKDAVRLFFELLVLKTKDMVDVKQPEAYGNIMITPKETLYTAITAAT